MITKTQQLAGIVTRSDLVNLYRYTHSQGGGGRMGVGNVQGDIHAHAPSHLPSSPSPSPSPASSHTHTHRQQQSRNVYAQSRRGS
ncbi:hypothetical protein EON63_17390, partial [archaeon]